MFTPFPTVHGLNEFLASGGKKEEPIVSITEIRYKCDIWLEARTRAIARHCVETSVEWNVLSINSINVFRPLLPPPRPLSPDPPGSQTEFIGVCQDLVRSTFKGLHLRALTMAFSKTLSITVNFRMPRLFTD